MHSGLLLLRAAKGSLLFIIGRLRLALHMTAVIGAIFMLGVADCLQIDNFAICESNTE
jgi:hypothetical protein